MALRGLILFLQELNIARPDDPERFVMEDGLTELLDGIYRYNVQIINLSMFLNGHPQADFPQEALIAILDLYHLMPEECLMLAATDRTLSLTDGTEIASVGYVNPVIPGQTLEKAQIIVEGFEEVDFYFLERMYQRKHNIPWTVIETERCILREMMLEDLDALYELYRGGNITRYIDNLFEDRKKEEEYTKAYIRDMYRFYGYGMWIAIERSTGKIIGRAGLSNRDLHGKPSLEIGYMIGEEFQNQGYATELCQGILQYAKEGTEFEEINCLIQKENKISIHLAEKLGFSWREEVETRGETMQRYTKLLHF